MILGLLLAAAQTAAAQSADRYRGGWRTDDSDPHTYEFSIRGERVRGIYCTLCSDARRWRLSTARWVRTASRSSSHTCGPTAVPSIRTRRTREIEGDRLIVTARAERLAAASSNARCIGIARAGSAARSRAWLPDATGKPIMLAPLEDVAADLRGALALRRPPSHSVRRRQRRRLGYSLAGARGTGGPAGPGAGGGAPGGRGWLQPGPWKNPLTLDDVVGAWIGFGTGVNKQYFIFRRVGNGLRGMVCGRCDNPFTLAALDDIEISGDTLRFKILHDGWGDAPVLPFDKWVTARIVANEMRAVFETPTEAGGRGVTGTPPAAAREPPSSVQSRSRRRRKRFAPESIGVDACRE